MRLFYLCILCVFFSQSGSGFEFSHDLHLIHIPGTTSKTIICCHGLGGDYRIAHILKKTTPVQDHLIGFNFVDAGIREGVHDVKKTTFGTFDELEPLLFILKKCVVDDGLDEISLYGFSAGGGAVINVLAALNTSRFDSELAECGIFSAEKKKILKALEKGVILLDTPLKSMEEILAFRGHSDDLKYLCERYSASRMDPIMAIDSLENLSLNIYVHFQNPDEVLSNRDDDLFIEKLKKANKKGHTIAIVTNGKGHKLPHPDLWKCYLERS